MILQIDEPNEKQRRAMLSKAKYVCFGGARGGGKSWFVQTKAKLMAFKYPGIQMLIVRKTYPELINNHIKVLRPELAGVTRYNDSQKTFTFVNGSTLQFMYCSNDGDLMHLQGCQYDVIFIDEATNLTEFQIRAIFACLRGTGGYPKRGYLTCNPGGPGHGFIKRLFIDRRFNDDESPEEYEFVQSFVQDNKALMKAQPDYINQLKNLPPSIRAAWLEGRWDVYEGQFFEDFRDDPEHYIDRQWTHVISPFEMPRSWEIYRSYDFGYSKPFSCAWWAVDYDGIIYRIMELYGCTNEPNVGLKWSPDKQFAEIHRIEQEHPWLRGKEIHGVADPAIWNAESGESVADTAMRYQVYFTPGDNKRIPGWMQMHYRMQFDENGFPRMYIFSNCKAFIRTIPLMMYSETIPEDLNTSLEDHVADEARYFCMSRPIKPVEKIAKEAHLDDPLDLFKDERKRRW